MKGFLTASLFLAAVVLTGCSGAKVRYVKPDFSAPDIVAILPADNHSNDLTAPRVMQGSVASGLIALGYFPINSPAFEDILREMGLTDGGQLNAYKLSDIADKLGVDGLVKTQIDTFSKINIGFYVSPTVECTVSIHDKTGEKLWEISPKWTEKKLVLDPTAALVTASSELVGDAVGKMFKSHLVVESQLMAGMMVQKAMKSRPRLWYPGHSYTPQ